LGVPEPDLDGGASSTLLARIVTPVLYRMLPPAM
jgi:hypothetical protein